MSKKPQHVNIKYWLAALWFVAFSLPLAADIEDLEVVDITLVDDNGNPDFSPIGVDSEDKVKLNLANKTKPRKTRKTLWQKIKGEKADNAFNVGMFTWHVGEDPNRDYRWHNDLVGIQYNGYTAGVFTNSHDQVTVFAGIGRRLWNKKIGNTDLEFQINYKAGLMYGYRVDFSTVPNVGGFTPFIMPYTSLVYKRLGLDFIVIPRLDEPILIWSGRINF